MSGFAHTRRLFVVLGLGLLLGAAAAIPEGHVLGSNGSDLLNQFVAWRAFAADSLRSGHFPLWNPWTFSGEPFFGGFQSALLYPPNWIFLVLPMAFAINVSILGHLALLGYGMGRWAAHRGMHPVASALVGLAVSLGGTVLPHVFAGHLPNLCTMAWAPWILLSLEEWFRHGRPRDLLLACAASCMQILAGHVQYAVYTGVAAVVFAGVRSVACPFERRRALAGAFGCFLAGAALAAVQVLPGMAAAGESVRREAMGYPFVGGFSFPFENLFTLVAPGFFGDLPGFDYWGRWYFWEMSVFVGASGVVLAALSLQDRARRRPACMDLIVAGTLFTLALGTRTPVFRALYLLHVPGFDRFRGLSKFAFPAMLFFALVLGAGADSLIRRRRVGRLVPILAMAAGLAAVVAGFGLRLHPVRPAAWLLDGIAHSHEIYSLSATLRMDPVFRHGAMIRAGRSLVVAGAFLVAAGASLYLSRRSPRLRWVPPALLCLELFGFARANFTQVPMASVPRAMTDFLAAHPGDYRVLWLHPDGASDSGYLLGAPTIWGNDPFVLRRYADFMAFTQGEDPGEVSQYVDFRTLSPLFGMLRCRFVFQVLPGGRVTLYENGHSLPRVLLVPGYRVPGGRDAIFAAMKSPDFDPRRTVLLENAPQPEPAAVSDPGSARVVSASGDAMTVEADLKAPELLLVTDPYSRDWHARPLAGSSQADYRILPADECLQAIPLGAGHHLVRIEYVPGHLKAGIAVSAAAWLAWLAGLTFWRPSWPRPSGASGRPDGVSS